MPIPPYSIDVNGNDNTPEWGYCTVAGCEEAAFPIWLSGEEPDDPDLYLCPKHIGARILHEQTARTAFQALATRAEDITNDLLVELAAARAELAAARELKEWTRKWQSVYVVSREMIAAMDAMDAATKARS